LILVDSHAHLESPQFKEDLESVISSALTAEVQAILTVGTSLDSSRAAVSLAEAHPRIYAAVGIHPHEAGRVDPDHLHELARMGRHDRVVAIGETGLDFYRNWAPPDAQRELFRAQLRLATELGKPVIIHDRDAHSDILSILRVESPVRGGVLHCFSGDLEMASQAMDMALYLSFAGPVTFRNARRLHSLVAQLPLDRLLVETDCPYLAPHPHRGKRNEPAYLGLVATKIAALKSLSPAQVAQATTANAQQLFGLDVA